MKTYLVLFLTLTLIACGPSQAAENATRVADSKPTVKEEFYPNGELKERTNYQSKDDGGKAHGLRRTWWDNGQLKTETTFKDGKRHGLVRFWYENGQLFGESTYWDGEEDGLRRMWHENGELRMETAYKDGKEHGFQRMWRENGQQHTELIYKDGKEHGLGRVWDENGQLFELCYSNGEEVGMSNCKG